MKLGIIEFSWTLLFQLFNTLVWVGIIYLIFYLVIKLPKRIKRHEEKIKRIESMLEEINKKLDK
ncbi:hypothetical protein [Clostridium formicaceticum]|uniref:DUF4083 domain-containing protein n=1 Tax=Clostridium formicaceticum TaxID=1497 RepID=A0AAC9WH24_9CLOT|nr:hypothetical protein [Clostridium formicaceticum]AOY76802.1 hypothetical protein BJL90_13635 [Clostridium formicaceticum]ARE87270.1 hypothetical protein CLFO_16690 [Clostridium formicaceticum]